MEEIKEYIINNKLNKKSRYRENLYPRYYLYAKLRDQGFTYKYIGDLFGKDHASIIHGIKTHSDLMHTKDKIYLKFTDEVRQMFGDLTLIRNLQEEILCCYNLETLKLIKKRIKMNLYNYI